MDAFVVKFAPPAPATTPGSIVNAASFVGGAIAPGEIVTIFASNAGPVQIATLGLTTDGKVATVAGNTRVLFDGVAAPIIYSVAGQISAIVPYSVAGKASVGLQVEYNKVLSAAVTIPVVAAAPAVFSFNSSGKGPALIVNESGCCNTPANPAGRGSLAVLYVTGEGQTTPGGVDGMLANYPTLDLYPRPVLPVKLTVGGVSADVQYAGAAPLLVAGVMLVNFQVPLDAPVGDAVPVLVTVGSVQTQVLTMAIK